MKRYSPKILYVDEDDEDKEYYLDEYRDDRQTVYPIMKEDPDGEYFKCDDVEKEVEKIVRLIEILKGVL